MPSVSSITSQYAKLHQKRSQKGGAGETDAPAPAPGGGGGLLSGIFGSGDDKKSDTNEPTTGEETSLSSSTAAAPATDEGGDSPSLLQKLGITSSEPKKEGDAEEGSEASDESDDSDVADIGGTEPPKKKEPSFLQKLGITSSESAPAPAPAPAPATLEDENKPSLLEKVGLGFLTSPSSEKKPEDDTESNSGESIDESSDESSDDDDDDNASDFKLIVDKMENLRKKYDDLKTKYKEEIRQKKETSPAIKDNSDFSNILASYFAIEGSLKQLKLYLKKHADKNGFPVEGLGLDDEQESAPVAPVAAPVIESEPVTDSDSESASTPAPAPAPAPAKTTESDQVQEEAPTLEDTTEQAQAPTLEDTTEQAQAPTLEDTTEQAPEDTAESATDSETENSNSDSAIVNTDQSSTVPEMPVQGAESSPGSSTTSNNGSFSGGRNHFVTQGLRKNKTHRHHKRRKRHQTLRANLTK